MDRLTHYNDARERYEIVNDYGDVLIDNLNYVHGNVVDRLAAYEDTGLMPMEIKSLWEEWQVNLKCLDKYRKAEADGRLIVLPCKVGDTVWKIVRHRVDVSGYRMEWEWETCIEAVKFSIGMFEAIGKTVFLTREEAEAACKIDETELLS